jgi:hypothetical protein
VKIVIISAQSVLTLLLPAQNVMKINSGSLTRPLILALVEWVFMIKVNHCVTFVTKSVKPVKRSDISVQAVLIH